jgi:transposase-like protein
MAQINITLNQEEILQLLATDREDAFKDLLSASLNSVLQAESSEQIQAGRYERSEDRQDSRNGFRDRPLTTRIGKITLHVPRHRNTPFETMVFDNFARSESALISTMAEMCVEGVSTRKVTKVMETLCDQTYSKSTVSNVCKQLDSAVADFRQRPLDFEYPFVIIDATYFKTRENHRIISKPLMIALGVNESGIKEIIGFEIYESETKESWSAFLESLKARGLHGVKMITSDAHDGILAAVCKTFPTVPWQRCQYHFTKNILEDTPKKYQEGLRSELTEMFNAEDKSAARKRKDEIISDYMDIAEKSMKCLDEGFDAAMTVMTLPIKIRKPFRTSNHLERLNEELKRRSKVIGIFPNAGSIIRLMGSVLMENHEHFQGMWKLFYKPDRNKLELIVDDLERIAAEQKMLLQAA